MGGVAQHYGNEDIVEKILAALAAEGLARDKIRASDLTPFDQLHGRELAATMDHVARLGCGPSERILDVGCGIGGPARFIASQCRSRVEGIDITPQFILAATELTALCGLSQLASFQLADANELPFQGVEFDGAVCLYVGMNLAEKDKVLREIARVLKPGGRLVWTEAVSAVGTPSYPLPWAQGPNESYVSTLEELKQMFRGAGLHITNVSSETAATIEAARATSAAGRPLSAGRAVVNEVVLGANFVERRRNFLASLATGTLDSVLIEATK